MDTDIKLEPVQAILRVDSIPKHFVYIRVDQEFYSHQNFEVHLNYKALEEEWMASPEKTIGLLGKQLTVEFFHRGYESSSQVFTGIISSAEMQSVHGGFGGIIVLKGNSPTILLDRGKHMQLFNEVGFKTIVNDLKKGVAQDKLDFICDPQYTESFNLVFQYNETDFDFINRLAVSYNEWFHYTGTELILGKPDERPATELVYDKHLSAIQIQTQLLPAKFNTYNYNSEKNLIENSPSANISKGVSGFLKVASDISNEVYTKEVIQLEQAVTKDKGELDKLNEGHKAKLSASMLIMKGVSSTSEVRIGRLVSVKLPEKMPVPKDLGEYRVVGIIHEIDEVGRYTNQFNAVPSALDYIPSPTIEIPQAYPQLAEVIDNKDEKNMGRVQIKFQWQKGIMHSPWVRVQAPDAGNSETAVKNRGIVFIPEKGDQVMVGFEHGDSSRPFVMGSMFHGQNSEGGGDGNSIKSIIDRDGNSLILSSGKKKGDEHSLVLKTSDKGLISITESKNNISISITSTKEVVIKSQTITLEGDTVNISATKKMTLKADDIILEGKNSLSAAAGKVDISGWNRLRTYGGQNMIMGKNDIGLVAPKVNTKLGGYSPPSNSPRTSSGQQVSQANQSAQTGNSSSPKVVGSSGTSTTSTNTTISPKEAKKMADSMDQVKKDFYQDYANWIQDLINMLSQWHKDMSVTGEDESISLKSVVDRILSFFQVGPVIDFVSDTIFFIGNKINDWVSTENEISCSGFHREMLDMLTKVKNGVNHGVDSKTSMFITSKEREELFDSFLKFAQKQGAQKSEDYTAKLDLFFMKVHAQYSPDDFYRFLTILWIKSSKDGWDWDGDAGVLEIFIVLNESNNFIIDKSEKPKWGLSEFYIDDVSNPDGVLNVLKSKSFNYGKFNALNLPIPVKLRIMTRPGSNTRYEFTGDKEIRYTRGLSGNNIWEWTPKAFSNVKMFEDFRADIKQQEEKLKTSNLKKD